MNTDVQTYEIESHDSQSHELASPQYKEAVAMVTKHIEILRERGEKRQ